MSHAFIFSNVLLPHLSILCCWFSWESPTAPPMHSQSRQWSLCSMWREAQNTLQRKKVSTRDSTCPQSWPGKEMLAWRPVWLWSRVWWPWGGLGKRIRQISLFITPFLMLLPFSVWQSLPCGWNSHVKTRTIWINFNNIDHYIIRIIVTLL